ncbi:MAG: S41 family peptidase [Campylobacterota bacterium]|nr:S41 family peptidase [Campylobacterota bacterium]
MATLYEAMTKISSESLYIEEKQITPKNILKNYIYNMDAYGDYFTKNEYQAFQDMLSPDYAGIGMILYQEERDGKILCIPSNKQLIEEGISKYDELISVNGRLVKGKNFYLVSSWIRGEKNSSVALEILKPSGELRTIRLKRSKQFFHSTQKVITNGTPMIQIIRFISETPQELKRILDKWPKNIPVIIDLRGNGGGDFFASIQSADLFLSKDRLIASIETTKSHIEYRASSPDSVYGRAVFVLQDKYTASASEVFIAALTQNNRVESIGERSFGKGVAQKFIPLSSGDALLLTYGKIITPNGNSYQKIGLNPTSNLSLEEFLK